jgi:hypothetical protein
MFCHRSPSSPGLVMRWPDSDKGGSGTVRSSVGLVHGTGKTARRAVNESPDVVTMAKIPRRIAWYQTDRALAGL